MHSSTTPSTKASAMAKATKVPHIDFMHHEVDPETGEISLYAWTDTPGRPIVKRLNLTCSGISGLIGVAEMTNVGGVNLKVLFDPIDVTEIVIDDEDPADVKANPVLKVIKPKAALLRELHTERFKEEINDPDNTRLQQGYAMHSLTGVDQQHDK